MRIEEKFFVAVAKIERMTNTVNRYTLVPVDSTQGLPAFQPGAHVETIVETSQTVFRRRYSICSPPDETKYYQISIQKSAVSRGGSAYWHEHVAVGQKLEISAPVNHFALSLQARHHVFVAGGIGITPFIPMICELAGMLAPSFHDEASIAMQRGTSISVQRPNLSLSWELHFAAKSPQECPFYDWLAGNFPENVHFYFSNTGQRLTPRLLMRQKLGTHLYLCGPQGLMQAFRDEAKRIGYPKPSVHMEAFRAQREDDDGPFEVRLARQNRQLTVPSHQTLLHVLRSAGIEVPSSCEVGGCGTCVVGVLAGTVDHRDFYLTEEEQQQNKQLVTCVSRAREQYLFLDV